MKICLTPKSSLLLLIASVLFCSCGTSRFAESLMASREKDKKAFVQTADGKIIEANEAKVRSPLFGKSTIELDNDVKIPTKEVVAYQNSYAYYRRVNGQFAPRFKKGLINMYSITENYTEWVQSSGPTGGSRMRNRTRVVYYMQKGDESPIERFSPDVTRNYVKDYAPAMEYMNVYDETKRKTKMWSWINTGAVIGGFALAAASYNSGTGKVNMGTGTAGLVLLGGGLVNGIVNKIRKVKNGKNLELAIDTYNYQTVRKKK